jgi:hypothetical protein
MKNFIEKAKRNKLNFITFFLGFILPYLSLILFLIIHGSNGINVTKSKKNILLNIFINPFSWFFGFLFLFIVLKTKKDDNKYRVKLFLLYVFLILIFYSLTELFTGKL